MGAVLSPFLQLAIELAIILLAAKLAGYISTRLGQPSVLGELLAGIILGPSLFDVLNLPIITNNLQLETTIHELGEMGVLLLMFIAGLDLHFNELLRNVKVSAYSGLLGVIFPVGLGWVAGKLLGMDQQTALFLGISLGATSVSISAQTLMELKVLKSRIGLGLLGAAVFDDILVILGLSTFLAFIQGAGSWTGFLIILGRMIGFFTLSVAFGLWILPRISRLTNHLPISQGVLTLSIIIMLVYGITAELLGGMAAITGAFLAGLMFSRSHEKERIEAGMAPLAYGLFVPIFLVGIGLSINIRDLRLDSIFLTFSIILVAIIGKFLGAGLGARLGGFNWRESQQMGVGMISRGEVGLIIANIGLAEGLISGEVFSAIIGMVLVSTLVTPPLLRLLFQPKSPPYQAVRSSDSGKE